MSFDYFYGQQSDLFTFYRVPKVLFTNERFWNISADAKMLYGILLDRMSLSAKNGWIDKNGRVYIIFTIDEAKMALNCAEQKAIKLLSELEKKAGLIERKRQGLGKPNLIYVKNFISAVDGRMIEIYLMVSLAPIPFSTFANREQNQIGQNYLRSLFALGFQGFLIIICVGIYAVLVQSLAFTDDIIADIWGIMGYTVLLCFTLFKTGTLAKSVFNAH